MGCLRGWGRGGGLCPWGARRRVGPHPSPPAARPRLLTAPPLPSAAAADPSVGQTFDAQLGVAQEQAALDALAAEAAGTTGAVTIRSASLEAQPPGSSGSGSGNASASAKAAGSSSKRGSKSGSKSGGGKGKAAAKKGSSGKQKGGGGHGVAGPARRLLASLQSLLPPFLSGRKLKQDLLVESGTTQVGAGRRGAGPLRAGSTAGSGPPQLLALLRAGLASSRHPPTRPTPPRPHPRPLAGPTGPAGGPGGGAAGRRADQRGRRAAGAQRGRT